MRSFHYIFLATCTASSTVFFSCQNQDQVAMREAYCRPTLEYQTTLNYLRESKLIKSSEAEARQIATQVASGCQGGAERFINVVELLSSAKIPANAVAQQAIAIANTTTAKAESFVTVFRYSFLSSHLDLDALSALRLAQSLSTDFKGDAKRASVDFSRLLDFCLGNLKLAKPACGEFASKVAQFGEKLAELPLENRQESWLQDIIGVFADDEGLVSKPYVEFFAFLTEQDKGPKLSTHDAHRLALQTLAHNPLAGKEFAEAFRFALEKDGLNMDRNEATKFAADLAMKTENLRLMEDGPAKTVKL